MGAKRINPTNGVLEEDHSFFIFENWEPIENKNGHQERINPETKVLEEDHSFFIFENWEPKE
jgi:hypothetical protein